MATPPPSPLPPSLPTSLPTLTTHPATTNAEKITALRLIADSVAQQRQVASRALITHPLPLSLAFLLLALLAQYFALPLMLTTGAGVVMALLVAVRGATGGYLVEAEKIGWKWLEDGNSGEDDGGRGKGKGGEETIVLVTVWGEEIIGALAIRVLKREKRALVRAWTVGLKYRGKGVGKALLEEGVRLAMTGRGCKAVEFEEDHASKWISPCSPPWTVQQTLKSTPQNSKNHRFLITPRPPTHRFQTRPARPLQPRLRPSRPKSPGHARGSGRSPQSGEELKRMV